MEMIYGIGYDSGGKYKKCIDSKKTREYIIWSKMFERCYSKKFHKIRPSYIDCTVDSRWHDFQVFCNDLPSLNGYELWKDSNNKMQLDKDCLFLGNKVYSKETCMFVTSKENNKNRVIRNNNNISTNIYKAVRKIDGYTELFGNRREFARKYNISYGNIYLCLNKKITQTRGWVFTKNI